MSKPNDCIAFPRPSAEMWLEKARQRFGNLPQHELREAAEWLEQEATSGLSSHLSQ